MTNIEEGDAVGSRNSCRSLVFQRLSSGIGEVGKDFRGSFTPALCFAGVGATLPDIPRFILRSDVTELSEIHPAGLRTLLLFPVSGSFLSLPFSPCKSHSIFCS